MPSESRRIFPSAITVFTVLLCASPVEQAAARTITVPDQAATIEDAMGVFDADTVIVRPGSYSEAPLISRPVCVLGAAGTKPELPGLRLVLTNVLRGGAYSYVFKNLALTGVVHLTNDDEPSNITFLDCELKAGLQDHSSYLETWALEFRRCVIGNQIRAGVRETFLVDSCSARGTVWALGVDASLIVVNSSFEGQGLSIGIYGEQIYGCTVSNTTVRGFQTGIASIADYVTRVSNVEVRDCTGIGILADGGRVTVTDSRVIGAAAGMDLESSDIIATDNRIEACQYWGMHIQTDHAATITRNVIVGNGEYGINVEGEDIYGTIGLRNNTVALNGGHGIVWEPYFYERFGFGEVVRNIVYANGGSGVVWRTDHVRNVTACNDWFGNVQGDVMGRSPALDDIVWSLCSATLRQETFI